VRLWQSRIGKQLHGLPSFLFRLAISAERLPKVQCSAEAVPQHPKASYIDNTDPERYRAWQINHKDQPFPSVSSYPNEDALVADVKKAIRQGTEKTGKAPRVLIIGALGRCGSGAVDLCLRVGIPTENVLKWDLAETGNAP
jgi:hypothetical protein